MCRWKRVDWNKLIFKQLVLLIIVMALSLLAAGCSSRAMKGLLPQPTEKTTNESTDELVPVIDHNNVISERAAQYEKGLMVYEIKMAKENFNGIERISNEGFSGFIIPIVERDSEWDILSSREKYAMMADSADFLWYWFLTSDNQKGELLMHINDAELEKLLKHFFVYPDTAKILWDSLDLEGRAVLCGWSLDMYGDESDVIQTIKQVASAKDFEDAVIFYTENYLVEYYDDYDYDLDEEENEYEAQHEASVEAALDSIWTLQGITEDDVFYEPERDLGTFYGIDVYFWYNDGVYENVTAMLGTLMDVCSGDFAVCYESTGDFEEDYSSTLQIAKALSTASCNELDLCGVIPEIYVTDLPWWDPSIMGF